MKNWLIKKLVGVPGDLHKEIVKDLKHEVDHHYQGYLEKCRAVEVCQDTIRRIEEKVRPVGIRSFNDEIRMRLQITDKPYMEFVFGTLPASLSINSELGDFEAIAHKKTIKMETMIGVMEASNDADLSHVSHELALNIARGCGKWVTNHLLEENGWRPKINRRDLS